MRNIRVLHIIPTFGPGGAERLVVELMQAMDGERFEVAAVSLYPESGTILEEEIRAKGLKVFYLNKHKGPDLRMIPQLYRLFRDFQPNVVHTHLSVLRYTLLPTFLCQVPVKIHTVHIIASKEVDVIGKVIHWMAFRFGRVVPVAISQMVARSIKNLYGHSIYVPVIYNGIPTRRFSSEAVAASVKNKRDIVLLHIGRFTPKKNHRLLIQAFELALNDYPRMRLWLVGDGPLRVDIEEQVAKMGLGNKVFFLGLQDNIPKILKEADMLLLPSDWEGVPLTVLEAMAAGKPVIATAVGGIPELIEDGITGMLIPPRDPQTLAKAILRLVHDPDLGLSMAEKGQRMVVEHFDISRTVKEYEMLYLNLLSKEQK